MKKHDCKVCRRHRKGLKKKLYIPIYNVELTLIVNRNIFKARKKMERVFGPAPTENNYNGLCSYDGYQFGIFLTPTSSMNPATVAHELFHVTHRILDYKGANFDASHHEPAALLNGYLSNLVDIELKKFHAN
jgi:hypothetical protein